MTVDEMVNGNDTTLTEDQMMALVDRHLAAEGAGDVEGAVAVYTDDVEHDPVGIPGGPFHGRDGSRVSTRTSRSSSAPRERWCCTALSWTSSCSWSPR